MASHPEDNIRIISNELISNKLKEDGETYEPTKFNTIVNLDLSFQSIIRISNLNDFSSLTKLILSNNNISSIDTNSFKGLSGLRWLDLSFNQIEAIQNLDCLTSLTDLNLGHNKITQIQGLDKLKSLELLSLSTNQISSFEGIIGLRSLTKLRSLTLKGNPMGEAPDYREYIIAHVSQIKWFDATVIGETERASAIESFKRELLAMDEKDQLKKDDQDKVKKVDAHHAAAILCGCGIPYDLFVSLNILTDQDTQRSLLIPCVRNEVELSYVPNLSREYDTFSAFMKAQCCIFLSNKAELEEAFIEVGRIEKEVKRKEIKREVKHEINRVFKMINSFDGSNANVVKKNILSRCDKIDKMIDEMDKELMDALTDSTYYYDTMTTQFENKLEELVSSTLTGIQIFFSNVRNIENDFHQKASQLCIDAIKIQNENENVDDNYDDDGNEGEGDVDGRKANNNNNNNNNNMLGSLTQRDKSMKISDNMNGGGETSEGNMSNFSTSSTAHGILPLHILTMLQNTPLTPPNPNEYMTLLSAAHETRNSVIDAGEDALNNSIRNDGTHNLSDNEFSAPGWLKTSALIRETINTTSRREIKEIENIVEEMKNVVDDIRTRITK